MVLLGTTNLESFPAGLKANLRDVLSVMMMIFGKFFTTSRTDT